MKPVLNPKQKLMIYACLTDADLNANGDIKQAELAKVLKVSQSTISKAYEEMRCQATIQDLREQLNEAKQESYLLLRENQQLQERLMLPPPPNNDSIPPYSQKK